MVDGPDPYQPFEESPPAEVSEIALQEERAIVARQYEMMQHIDDRALRITRTSAVLLGIVLTGVSLMTQTVDGSTSLHLPQLSTWGERFGAGGILLLIGSIVVGTITTQYSRPIYGPGMLVRHSISARRNKWQALAELSNEYDDAIDEMQGRVERNRTLLWALQIAFICALVSLAVGAYLAFESAVVVG